MVNYIDTKKLVIKTKNTCNFSDCNILISLSCVLKEMKSDNTRI